MIRSLAGLFAISLALTVAPLLASPEKYLEVPPGVGRLATGADALRRPRELQRQFARAYRAFDANEGRDERNNERPWSSLGYPAGRVTWHAGAGAFVQRFKGGRYGDGAIVVAPTDERQLRFERGAVSGVFFTWWEQVGGLDGRMGRPIGVQYRVGDTWEQRYSGGRIRMREESFGLAPSWRYRD